MNNSWHKLQRAVPVLLAVFFAVWALRGVGANNLVDTDAARHAMNGAFVHDLASSGKVLHPIEYGRFYYGHLPALSMPYHPPLFPVVESLFFWLLGVNVFAARLAVAVATGAAAYLLYRLILATHQSRALAVAVTLSFFFWPQVQFVSGDVMLEMPSLALACAAIYVIRNLGEGEYTLRRGLLFALLAGASVWMKQVAIFLGLVPFLYIVISRRWRLLAGKTIWISSILFGLQIIGLWALTLPFNGVSTEQVPPAHEFFEILSNNGRFYFGLLHHHLGLPITIFLCVTLCLSLVDFWGERRLPGRALYPAWAIACLMVLLWIGAYDIRYLLFAMPPLIVIAYHALERVASLVLSPRYGWLAPAAVAAFCAVLGVSKPAPVLRGPSEAAAEVLRHAPKRVLYCGAADGNFIFAVRSLERRLHTVVLSGDKLPTAVFRPASFEEFANRYGIEYVVLEEPMHSEQPYAALASAKLPALRMEGEIAMNSYPARWQGHTLKIYRFLNPSATPENVLTLNDTKLGPALPIKLLEREQD